MIFKPLRFLLVLALLVGLSGAGLCKSKVKGDILFTDDFEKGAGKWDLINPDRIEIVETGDEAHGKVLALQPGGPGVYALIKGSDNWTNIRVEGEIYFPHDFAHYVGFIYNYRERGRRVDFGSIFCVGNHPPLDKVKNTQYLQIPPDDIIVGNSIMVNPHRDGNANRSLSVEYHIKVDKDKEFLPRKWHQFKAEVLGPICHFYLGDMETPKITYDFFEFSSGRVGLKPRYSGSQLWVDNVKVTSINELSYKGPILPAGINHKPEKLITKWDVIGPFGRRIHEIEKDGFAPGKTYVDDNIEFKWQPFKTDGRGCVISGMICEKFSGKVYAYFHTEIVSPEQKKVSLEFSTTDNLFVWVNGNLAGGIGRSRLAWHDFWENPEHAGGRVKATLNPGKNHVIVLCQAGVYGGDGFFAFCRPDEQPGEKTTAANR